VPGPKLAIPVAGGVVTGFDVADFVVADFVDQNPSPSLTFSISAQELLVAIVATGVALGNVPFAVGTLP